MGAAASCRRTFFSHPAEGLTVPTAISVRRREKRSLKFLCIFDAHEYDVLDEGVLPFADKTVGDSSSRQQLKRMIEQRFTDKADGKVYSVWAMSKKPTAVFEDFAGGDRFDSSMLQDRDGEWLLASQGWLARRQKFIDEERVAFAQRVEARVSSSTQALSKQLAGLVNDAATASTTPAASKAVAK